MLNKFQQLFKSDLVKVFSFTSLSTLFKLITSYVSVKVVAAFIGPSGIALVGQLQNFINILTTLGGGGINSGVVKYVSEYREKEEELKQFLRNGWVITLFFSLFFGTLLIFFSAPLSKWILLSITYQYVFIYFGISLIFIVINNFLVSVINGYKEFKQFVLINIISSVIGLAFTVALVFKYHLKGALIASVTYQGVVLLITVFLLRNSNWLRWNYFKGKWNGMIIKKFLSFSIMAFVSVATVPVSQMIIRSYIINNYSITEAGFWEGINRISGLFLLFVTTSFSVYYLPKLSEIKIESILKKEILKTYKIISPIVFTALCGLYVSRELIIKILFTREFYPMRELFLWQLIGDFFKILSWILAFVMVAKSMTKIFVITEILFSSLLVFLSILFINQFGIKGATLGYCLTYFIYFVVMIIIFKNLLFKSHE